MIDNKENNKIKEINFYFVTREERKKEQPKKERKQKKRKKTEEGDK